MNERMTFDSSAVPRVRWPAADALRQSVARVGYAVVEEAIPTEDLGPLARALEQFTESRGRGGVRNMLREPAVADLVRSARFRALAQAVLGDQCFAVRAILFDKSPSANWMVIWHQDTTIAVKERREVDGFGPWSTKGGMSHVQPPSEVLERMLALRLHLDDCGPLHGPLRVIPGSHAFGRMPADSVEEWKRRGPQVDCPVRRGDVIAMRPLLLHASTRAQQPTRRRVLHVEVANATLPKELEWLEQV